jgi:hypothetical protein
MMFRQTPQDCIDVDEPVGRRAAVCADPFVTGWRHHYE